MSEDTNKQGTAERTIAIERCIASMEDMWPGHFTPSEARAELATLVAAPAQIAEERKEVAHKINQLLGITSEVDLARWEQLEIHINDQITLAVRDTIEMAAKALGVSIPKLAKVLNGGEYEGIITHAVMPVIGKTLHDLALAEVIRAGEAASILQQSEQRDAHLRSEVEHLVRLLDAGNIYGTHDGLQYVHETLRKAVAGK